MPQRLKEYGPAEIIETVAEADCKALGLAFNGKATGAEGKMDCYLCKHCENLTNFPLDGLCEESPDGEHQWVTGDEVEIYVSKLWERPPVLVSNSADINGMSPPA